MLMKPNSDDPSCRICGESVDPADDYCFGCKSFICADCTGESVLLMGDHDWSDHIQVQ
jgi:hypothetical protein